MVEDEKRFISQINRKEEEAFHQLFQNFHSYLVLFAMRRVRELEAAEDIVQETFISVWENAKRYDSYKGLVSWMYELCLNRCLNYLKHKQVESKYHAYVHGRYKEEYEHVEVTQEEVYRHLYLAVRELPEKCRAVFELYLEGKKNDEIATTLGISVLTVKAHKQNAVRILKERMGRLFFLFFLLRKNQVHIF